MASDRRRSIMSVLLLGAFMAVVFCVNSAIAGKGGDSEQDRLTRQQFINSLNPPSQPPSNQNPNSSIRF